MFTFCKDVEEDDYEDPDDDDEDIAMKRRRKKRRTKTIFEMYEPSELEVRHFTDQDNEIRNTDIPERMQLRNFPVTVPDDPDEEFVREAEWIFDRFTQVSYSISRVHSGKNLKILAHTKKVFLKTSELKIFNFCNLKVMKNYFCDL